jgi:NDP-sugar pyrophosphorylase family protein
MEEQHEKPLQAVLLADSFTSTFRPISLEVPKVLFPLGNAPMLSYSLEFLASNDVKQVFIFCINHPEQIRKYVESSGKYHCVFKNFCVKLVNQFQIQYIVLFISPSLLRKPVSSNLTYFKLNAIAFQN